MYLKFDISLTKKNSFTLICPGVCCVALNFVSTNLLAIIPCDQRAHLVMNEETENIKILKESECFGLPSNNVKRVFVVMILPIFILFSWLPSIKSVAPFAKVANYFMLIPILITGCFFGSS